MKPPWSERATRASSGSQPLEPNRERTQPRLWLPITIAGSLILAVEGLARATPPSPAQPNSFDGTTIGARPVGMGEAFTAVADTADAPYWNPAGLAHLSQNLMTVMLEGARHSALPIDQIVLGQPLQGRKLTYLAAAGHQGAISYRPLANQRKTVVLSSTNPSANVKETKFQVDAFTLSTAHTESERSSVGLNLTYLNGHAGLTQLKEGEAPAAVAASGHGVSLDVGMLMTLTSGVQLGITGQNIPGYLWWDEFDRDRLPPTLKSGIAVTSLQSSTFAFDYEKRFYTLGDKQPGLLHLGGEVWLGNVVALRGGISGERWDDPNKVRYTAGIGAKRGMVGIDLGMRKFQFENGPQVKAVYEYVTSVSLPL